MRELCSSVTTTLVSTIKILYILYIPCTHLFFLFFWWNITYIYIDIDNEYLIKEIILSLFFYLLASSFSTKKIDWKTIIILDRKAKRNIPIYSSKYNCLFSDERKNYRQSRNFVYELICYIWEIIRKNKRRHTYI